MSVRVLVGDARAVLAGLEPESVSMCVTSPPFYSLRHYSTELQVWGARNLDCQHEWVEVSKKGYRTGQGFTGASVDPGFKRQIGYEATAGNRIMSGVCRLCGSWLGELGLEPIPDCLSWAKGLPGCGQCYVCHIVEVFQSVRRVLHRTGTLFLNLGDSFASGGNGARDPRRWPKQSRNADGFRAVHAKGSTGLRPTELMGIPWRCAFALQADGWWLRQAITLCKRAPMPESVESRPTSATEMLFLFARSKAYFYDYVAVRQPPAEASLLRIGQPTFDEQTGGEKDYANGVNGNRSARKALENFASNPGANLRNWWPINPSPFSAADLGIEGVDHYATFSPAIPDRAIRAGTSQRGVCAACLAPWRRVVERRHCDYGMGQAEVSHQKAVLVNGNAKVRVRTPTGHSLSKTEIEAIDWRPTCACNAGDPRPATVLDCFAGSGTTLMVADRLGRDAIGIELNESYCDMALKRVESDRLARDPILREQAAARAGGWTAPTLFDLDGRLTDADATLDLSRPQARRALELFRASTLTPDHLRAIRAAGVTDAGKAQIIESGFGKNTEEVQRLAAEAKAALGGYYREFLFGPLRDFDGAAATGEGP